VTSSLTVGDLIGRALHAYETLTSLGEDVEDEWSYVNDLSTAWRDRLEAVAAVRGSEPSGEPMVSAIDRLADEVARITDPHRAIDWLSTFPQVALLALGEET
jgi:hypothetical protein